MCPKVSGEFVLGDSLPVSRPGVNPDFRFWQDPYTEVFKYENCGSSLRQLFWRVIKMMPKDLTAQSVSSSNRPAFSSGYYEIGIAKDPESDTPRIYFYDAKPWGKRQ